MTKGREPTAEERTAILLEEMRSNFKLVIEKVQDSDKKLINLGKKMTNVEEKLDDLIIEVKVVKKDVQDIKEQLPPMQFILREHDQRLKKVEGV